MNAVFDVGMNESCYSLPTWEMIVLPQPLLQVYGGAKDNMKSKLIEAIRNSELAKEKLDEALRTGDENLTKRAFQAYEEAEVQRKIQAVEDGQLPAFPPRTEAGRARWGLAKKEIEEILNGIALKSRI